MIRYAALAIVVITFVVVLSTVGLALHACM